MKLPPKVQRLCECHLSKSKIWDNFNESDVFVYLYKNECVYFIFGEPISKSIVCKRK